MFSDGLTRRVRGGVLALAFQVEGRAGVARVRQRPDGWLEMALEHPQPDAAERHVRFLLAVDMDVRPYLAGTRGDSLVAASSRVRAGLRPLRSSTVAHAVLRAAAGQLIASSRARRIERALLRRTGTPAGELIAPPDGVQLRERLSPAAAEACGLSPRRAAALCALARRVDLEGLRTRPALEAAARIAREPGFGPWSAGLVATHGLGSLRLGPAGDLGLVRMCSQLLGRPAGVEDTAAMLARYDPFAALAGLDLLAHPLAARGAAPAPGPVCPPRAGSVVSG
jgi:3-methyladenine DNA glycosylase/8-oxoguanine DNA glycosylase